MNRFTQKIAPLLLALALALTACGGMELPASGPIPEELPAQSGQDQHEEAESEPVQEEPEQEAAQEDGAVSLENIPAYAGEPYVAVNANQPFFTPSDYTTEAFELYSDLDQLGRCGVAWANICRELMPTEERGEIGQVKPSGWHTVKYDCVDGGYLYNRCHLIGFQLAGENANEKNLITGTRYLNIQGMLPFENLVADYVQETDNHVLYRVTPIFVGENLVASGVLMEGWSVEDGGEGVCFCVYAYNSQPGVEIDYATGESRETGEEAQETVETPEATEIPETAETTASSGEMEYVLNTNSHKFHYPDCSSVANMSPANRQDVTGTREDLIAQGYDPCGICKP